jgi:antitoxin MazE
MVTKIQKWGNSQGLRVPRAILERARLDVGDTVEIVASEKRIVVKAAGPVHGQYKLANLLKNCRGKVPETDWGPPQGMEAH